MSSLMQVRCDYDFDLDYDYDPSIDLSTHLYVVEFRFNLRKCTLIAAPLVTTMRHCCGEDKCHRRMCNNIVVKLTF